ncbi:hypothetical protein ACEWY4_019900 [Coilia grayii]|uniref:Holliday junction regulator protein family C-terminal domain-containing protein n=1 Tax=Coilia grayii TaxID=363190 RepID=A0ABD1JB31_9TELE
MIRRLQSLSGCCAEARPYLRACSLGTPAGAEPPPPPPPHILYAALQMGRDTTCGLHGYWAAQLAPSPTLRKKGFNGCNSPEPDGEDSIDQSPLNEDKYRKSEELDILFKRYGSTVPAPTFSMPVTVPVTNQSPLQFSSNPSSALVTTSFVTSTLTDPRLLSPQQPALQRNTVSPGLPQRPASAGALLGGDLNNSNGACPSPVANGYISARASPGLLSVSNGNSMGKVVPAKSPPPPSPQMVNSRKPDLRVITSQGGKSLLQLTDEELELVSENAQRLGASQVTQPLTTPVVSVATPSLLTPFSAMPTAYNPEYQLTSADLTALQAFTSPGGLLPGNMTTWQQQQQPSVSQQPQQQQPQQQQQQQQQQQPQQLSLASLSNLVPMGHLPQGATLTVNTNPNVSIKSEPVSPNRDRSTPSSSSSAAAAVAAGNQSLAMAAAVAAAAAAAGAGGAGGVTAGGLSQYPGALRLEPTGRSPVDSLSSNGSSYEGSDRDEGGQPRPPDFATTMGLLRPSSEAAVGGGGGAGAAEQSEQGANVKRMRLDTWVT